MVVVKFAEKEENCVLKRLFTNVSIVNLVYSDLYHKQLSRALCHVRQWYLMLV